MQYSFGFGVLSFVLEFQKFNQNKKCRFFVTWAFSGLAECFPEAFQRPSQRPSRGLPEAFQRPSKRPSRGLPEAFQRPSSGPPEAFQKQQSFLQLFFSFASLA